jgi:hypothetical protein
MRPAATKRLLALAKQRLRWRGRSRVDQQHGTTRDAEIQPLSRDATRIFDAPDNRPASRGWRGEATRLEGRRGPSPCCWAMSIARQRVGRRAWLRTSVGVRVSQPPDYTESPMPRASTSGERVRFHVENGVAVPTRVHTVSKGALIMGISTRFRISTDGYEEGND